MKLSGIPETLLLDLGWFNEGSGNILSGKGVQKVSFLEPAVKTPHPVVLFSAGFERKTPLLPESDVLAILARTDEWGRLILTCRLGKVEKVAEKVTFRTFGKTGL